MKISALQSYFTYMVILIEYWAKWLIRSLQGTVCLILFWNVCLHKCHTRKSLEATIICNVKIFQFLWSFPSPEGSNSSPLVDKSSQKHPPPAALVSSRNMTLFLSRHADKWWIRLSLRKRCSSFPKAHCCLDNSGFPPRACFNSLYLHEENTRGMVWVWFGEGYQVPSRQREVFQSSLLQSLPGPVWLSRLCQRFRLSGVIPACSLLLTKEHFGTLGTPKIAVKTAKHDLTLPATHTNAPTSLKRSKKY